MSGSVASSLADPVARSENDATDLRPRLTPNKP
jgi:hypothetical protein